MKSMIATTLLFASTTALGMTNRPDGVYQGQGRWNDNRGQTGRYEITTTVKSDVVSSTYNLTWEESLAKQRK